MPPAPAALPPKTGGFLARIWASRFAFGPLMKLIADLEAPRRKTPTLKKPRDRPTPGGSAEAQRGAGGMSSQSAQPVTRSPPNLGGSAEAQRGAGGMSSLSAKPTSHAGHQPTNRRQVCPPPERSEIQGGCGDRREAAGGAKRREPRSLALRGSRIIHTGPARQARW